MFQVLRISLWCVLKLIHIFYLPVYPIRFFKKSLKPPPVNDELLLIPAFKIAEKIRHGKLSCEKIIRAYINRIKEVNPMLNAVVEDRFSEALEDAKKVDEFIKTTTESPEAIKQQYPLLGLPITIKASIAVSGMKHHAGVVLKRNTKAESDAVSVKYARNAGAIPIATTNVPELCLNWETTNKLIGTTRNPYDTTRTAGGSSGGEASLMGAGASLIGIGSDIAGSLRLPAHFCGIYGHKPSPGVVSFIGHYPDCKSVDDWRQVFTLGPLARYAGDLRLLLQVIAEPQMKERLKLCEPVNIKNINYFYIEEIDSMLMDSIRSPVRKAIQQVVDHLSAASGNKCVKANFSLMKYASELSYLRLLNINNVENLFDDNGKGAYLELFKFLTFRSESELTSIFYGILRRYVDYIPNRRMDKVFEKLDELRRDFLKLLGDSGVLICPTFPDVAHSHGDVYKKLFSAGYLSIFNALGFPATNCPITYTLDGMPVGIQIVAAPNCDRLTLTVAEELEKAFGGWRPFLQE